MRWSYLLVMLLGLGVAPGWAQIIAATPKEDSIAKRHAKHLIDFRGKQAIIGEPKSGIECGPDGMRSTAKDVEIWVADPKDPLLVPYDSKRERRPKAGSAGVVRLVVAEFTFEFVDRLQTLEGLAQEYQRRRELIDGLQTSRDKEKKGGSHWFSCHVQMLAHLTHLYDWLRNVGYPLAAQRTALTIEKEKKAIAKEAIAARELAALSSVQPAEVPAALVRASEKILGDGQRFKAITSQHIRYLYIDEVPDEGARNAVSLGERIIESFRREFVDPYLDAGYLDHIPDGRLVEVLIVPDDAEIYERFLPEYFGVQWGAHKEEALKMSGKALLVTSRECPYGIYWRLKPSLDLDGMMAHRLGHILANVHYNANRASPCPAWLEEAAGYYVSFEHLGRNTVTCFSWGESRYAKPAKKEGDRTVQAGLKGAFSEVAVAKGPPVGILVTRLHHEFDDADLAKAWSLFDFVARDCGIKGQLWLRAQCDSVWKAKGAASLAAWRADSERLFGVDPKEDVFKVIEDRWRAYAEKQRF
ncbi:MAG: hypothetical protein AB1486_07770 [Planctomycetota bacterium]